MTRETLTPSGFLATATYQAVPIALRTKLMGVPIPVLSAALHRRGFSSHHLTGVHPLNPNMTKFCGAAWTLRAIPMREDFRSGISTATVSCGNRRAFEAAPAGAVVVCGSGGLPNVRFAGNIIGPCLANYDIEGVVLDASVFDGDNDAARSLRVIAAGPATTSSPTPIMVIDHDTPVGFHNVAVFPGDIIIGDSNGAICIPRHLAEDLANTCTGQEHTCVFRLEPIAATFDGSPLPSAATMLSSRAPGLIAKVVQPQGVKRTRNTELHESL